ncbi:hypothetical protein Syun_021746 [Stephania yunnanensis]|uniref:Uncharacterized protein n=1 Tax=Stephania yunnanensis TaxID=152371 RepID=A0AAP0IG67_9MAGN
MMRRCTTRWRVTVPKDVFTVSGRSATEMVVEDQSIATKMFSTASILAKLTTV